MTPSIEMSPYCLASSIMEALVSKSFMPVAKLVWARLMTPENFWHSIKSIKSFSLIRPFLAGLVSDCAFEICGDRTLSLELEIKINKWIYCLYIILSQGHSVLCRLILRWARISKKYIFGAASWAYLEQSWPKKRKPLACTNIIHFVIFCIFEMLQSVI